MIGKLKKQEMKNAFNYAYITYVTQQIVTQCYISGS